MTYSDPYDGLSGATPCSSVGNGKGFAVHARSTAIGNVSASRLDVYDSNPSTEPGTSKLATTLLF